MRENFTSALGAKDISSASIAMLSPQSYKSYASSQSSALAKTKATIACTCTHRRCTNQDIYFILPLNLTQTC